MSPGPKWAGLALAVLFGALVIDALRTGEAWTRTGRNTSRVETPALFWLYVAIQAAFAAVCLTLSLREWMRSA